MSDRARCPRCGRILKPGDWPWCQGKPDDHLEPHYTFTWGKGGAFTRKGTGS